MQGGYSAGSNNEQNTFTLGGGSITDDMAGDTTGYNTNFTGLGQWCRRQFSLKP
jgi:hypothetical protein